MRAIFSDSLPCFCNIKTSPECCDDPKELCGMDYFSSSHARRERSDSTIDHQGVPMTVQVDEYKPEGSIGSNEAIPVPVDGTEEPQFEIPVSRSNYLDPERRSKEFRARHIQMMALGKCIRNL